LRYDEKCKQLRSGGGGRRFIWPRPPRVTSPHQLTRAATEAAAAAAAAEHAATLI